MAHRSFTNAYLYAFGFSYYYGYGLVCYEKTVSQEPLC